MIIYYIVIFLWVFVLTFLNSLSFRKTETRNLIFVFFVTVTLIFLYTFRSYDVGSDTRNYIFTYNEGVNVSYRNWEFGFYYFRLILLTVGAPEIVFLFSVALLIYTPVAVLIFKYSKNIMESFFLFLTIGLFSMSLSGMQQMIAISLSSLAIVFMLKKNFLTFYVFVFLATSFHYSALVLLPLPLLFLFRKRLISESNYPIYLFIIMILLVFNSKIFYFFVVFLPSDYGEYLFGQMQRMNWAPILVGTAIPVACHVFLKKCNLDDKSLSDYKIFLLMSYVNSAILIFSRNISLGDRFGYYFAMVNIVLLVNVVSSVKEKELRVVSKLALYILPAIQFLLSTPGGVLNVDNYKFMWQ